MELFLQFVKDLPQFVKELLQFSKGTNQFIWTFFSSQKDYNSIPFHLLLFVKDSPQFVKYLIPIRKRKNRFEFDQIKRNTINTTIFTIG
jgi:hypothetical protein